MQSNPPHRVLITDPLAPEAVERLRSTPGIEVIERLGIAEDTLLATIGGFDALIVRSETKVTGPVIAAARRLKIIGRAGAGVDNIDVAMATHSGVVVANCPDGNTVAVAELAVALLLAVCRRIPQADATLRSGLWNRKQFMGTELCGKTVGIVGLGKIGSAVARRLAGFDARVIAYDHSDKSDLVRSLGIEQVPLAELFTRSDFITVHVPLTAETRGMIGAPEIAGMKDGVCIINCARGDIVDELALAEAVVSGKVGGAAVDVFAHEPPEQDNPLLGLPQVVVTPHLGASSREAQVRVAVDIVEQVIDVLQGKSARNAVN